MNNAVKLFDNSNTLGTFSIQQKEILHVCMLKPFAVNLDVVSIQFSPVQL